MKEKIVIIEGCPTSGKSTIGNELREKLPYTTLMSLTGVKDKSYEGKDKAYKYHMGVLDYLESQRNSEMNYVLCRSFLSEQVYCSLGFKPYKFDYQFDLLLNNLEYLAKYYDIYFILLEVEEEQIESRIDRNKHEYHKYSVKDSLVQQEEYKRQMRYIVNNTESIKCYSIVNDNINKTVNTIKEIILDDMLGDK